MIPLISHHPKPESYIFPVIKQNIKFQIGVRNCQLSVAQGGIWFWGSRFSLLLLTENSNRKSGKTKENIDSVCLGSPLSELNLACPGSQEAHSLFSLPLDVGYIWQEGSSRGYRKMNGDPRNSCLVKTWWDAACRLPMGTLGIDEQKRCQVASKAVWASCILQVPEAVQEAKRCCQKWCFSPCQHNHKHEMQLSNWLQTGDHAPLESVRWGTKQPPTLPVHHHRNAVTIFVEYQLTSTSQVEQTTATSAFKHQRKTLKPAESTEQKSPWVPLGCLWLSFWRIVIAIFWRQWTYWTSFLSAIGVSGIKGVCARLCVCTGLAGGETDETGRGEKKNGQLKKEWKMRVDGSPDLRLYGSWKMNHSIIQFKEGTSTHIFFKGILPVVRHILWAYWRNQKSHLLWARLIPGIEHKQSL